MLYNIKLSKDWKMYKKGEKVTVGDNTFKLLSDEGYIDDGKVEDKSKKDDKKTSKPKRKPTKKAE